MRQIPLAALAVGLSLFSRLTAHAAPVCPPEAAQVEPVSWLESAALHYQDGRWIMDFLHATRVPAPAK